MSHILSPLDIKLLRDLWRIRGQAAAIMFVIAAGLALYVMSDGMLGSLKETRRAYYERQQFADAFAPVKRAPNYLLEDIQNLPGVARAEGRVVGGAIIDLPDVAQPITSQVLSAPEHGRASLNLLHIVTGRTVDITRADEIVLLEPFARAHGLNPGDSILVTLHGAQRRLDIVGLALSPGLSTRSIRATSRRMTPRLRLLDGARGDRQSVRSRWRIQPGDPRVR
ncbi:MAG: hypothetical protein R3C55_15790 [Parvularculaceae bacterium]